MVSLSIEEVVFLVGWYGAGLFLEFAFAELDTILERAA